MLCCEKKSFLVEEGKMRRQATRYLKYYIFLEIEIIPRGMTREFLTEAGERWNKEKSVA